jgi:hypothetical protein
MIGLLIEISSGSMKGKLVICLLSLGLENVFILQLRYILYSVEIMYQFA